MGIRKLQIANLSLETPHSYIRTALAKYGEVKGIVEELWARHYRFAIPNGIRIVELNLKKHAPSHMMIAGQRVLI
jgi:hypothetical protein